MENIQITDGDGETFPLYRYNGKFYPPFSKGDLKSNVDAFIRLKVREDDVFIAAYPKAGKHWVYEITNMLLTGSVEYQESYATSGGTGERKFDEMKSPRVFASHFLFEDFPVDIHKKKCRILYVTRNIKDTAVSFYNHLKKMEAVGYNGTFTSFLPVFMRGEVPYGSWMDHTKDWETVIQQNNQLPILHLHYEDMKKDLLKHVKKIADFLGVEENEELFKKITHRCTFQTMKDSNEFGRPWKSLTKDGTSPICRKGEVGDWKNWFTLADNEKIEDYYNKEMKQSSFQFQYTHVQLN